MIHLLTGVYESVFKQEEYKILLLGLDGSGKTTALERIRYHEKQKDGPKAEENDAFSALKSIGTDKPKRAIDPTIIKPTIGLNITRASCLGHKLLFWDMGGKAALQPLWYNYTHQCHAVIFYCIT